MRTQTINNYTPFKNMLPNTLHQPEWYAIRVTYSREMKLKEFLDAQAIENFIPMNYKLVKKNGRRVKALVPAINNLVFVRSTKNDIDEIKKEKAGIIPIRYIIDKSTCSPIIVPESQMRNFIIVAGCLDEQLLYLDENIETVLKKGDKVRVMGGAFAGVEGVILRIKRDRRVVVSIKGLITVATAYIQPQLIQRIIG